MRRWTILAAVLLTASSALGVEESDVLLLRLSRIRPMPWYPPATPIHRRWGRRV